MLMFILGLLDSMAGFWSTVAKYFKDDENILGYELINEPWAGDIYSDVGLLLPTIADLKNFQPMYDRLNEAIRSVDEQHWLVPLYEYLPHSEGTTLLTHLFHYHTVYTLKVSHGTS